MKHCFACLLFFCCILPVGAQSVDFSMNLARFLDPDKKPYAEIALSVDAATLQFQKNAKGFSGKALIAVDIFLLNENQKLNPDSFFARKNSLKAVYQKDIELQTQTLADSALENRQFNALYVQRVALEPGDYFLAVEVKDAFAPAQKSTMTITQQFFIEKPKTNEISFSDITFIENFRPTQNESYLSKNGFDVTPFVSNGAFMNQDTLRFYLEYYQAHLLNAPLYLSAYITDANSSQVIDKYKKNSRPKMMKDYEVFTTAFNIKELSTQTYYLNFELKKTDGSVAASAKTKFFVYNKDRFTDFALNVQTDYEKYYNYKESELDYFLDAQRYISSNRERSFAASLKTFDEKKNYFMGFWQKRSPNPADPAQEWRNYLDKIRYCNKQFRIGKRDGWKSERGRVMLVYGAPDDIQYFDAETDKQPYQIWTYNRLGNQAGVIFVFACRNIAINDYTLIHSTKTGETQNANWRTNLMNNRGTDYNMENSDYTTPDFKDNVPSTSGGVRSN